MTELFQTTSFSYGNRTFGNHNRVLGYMGAVDGIKTGFINASGSNLMTAARKNGRHVVVIAFGFNSGAARDEKVRAHFEKGRQGDYLQTAMIPLPGRQSGAVMVAQPRPVPVIPMPMPGFRLAQLVAINNAVAPEPVVTVVSIAGLTAANAAAGLAGLEDGSYQNRDVIGAWLSDTLRWRQPRLRTPRGSRFFPRPASMVR